MRGDEPSFAAKDLWADVLENNTRLTQLLSAETPIKFDPHENNQSLQSLVEPIRSSKKLYEQIAVNPLQASPVDLVKETTLKLWHQQSAVNSSFALQEFLMGDI